MLCKDLFTWTLFLPYFSLTRDSIDSRLCRQPRAACNLVELVPVGMANCGIRHVTVPLATRILIANVRHIGVSNICVINLVYFKMQV